MPDTAWPISGHPPGSSRSRFNTPVLMSTVCVTTRQQWFTRVRLPDPHLTDYVRLSPTLTTTVFNKRSLGRFEASLRRATPKGHDLHHPSSIAPDHPPTSDSPSRSGHTEPHRSRPAPAFIGVGEVDSFFDEDVDYAVRLSCAGVPTELQVYPGVIHGGFVARPGTRRTRQFLADAHETLATAFE
jgi:acetyl esterase/lipase